MSKKSGRKKVVRRTAKKTTERGVMAIVPYSEIVKPITHNGSMSLVATHFGPKVLKFITQPTPKQYVSKREGAGGKIFDYVDGHYAKKCANYAFGFSHSMTILEQKIVGTSVVTLGRLIITDPKTGKEILHKDDNGSHTIRFLKDKTRTPENAVDIGNDYKASVTDCLKRCMVQIGFFSDVYGKAEAVETGIVVQEEKKDLIEQKTESGDISVSLECENCGNPITESEAKYSKKMYRNRAFCRQCQPLAKKGGPLA